MMSRILATVLLVGSASCRPEPSTAHDAEPQPSATAAASASAPDANAPVAKTSRFTFYSRLSFNLDDRLRRWAVDGVKDGARCIDAAPADERKGWLDAAKHFEAFRDKTSMAPLRARFALVDPKLDFEGRLGDVPDWFFPALASAEPAYKRCLWQEDDARNRKWIAAVLPLLEKAEGRIAERIAAVHGEKWEGPIPIDVVSWSNEDGAHTVNPAHTEVGSTHAANQGYAALEIVFHEASHTMINPRSGASIVALQREADATGVTLPRDLWHAVLFVTAGEITRGALRESFGVEYQQYIYTNGLFAKAWPELEGPVERYWLPYVRGETKMDEAVKGLVAAFAVRK
ncbi:MAG: hypothetical protein HOV80_06370 [Polyangiaceae bacterium]|nr:hypothetical protein [Polyangiaceae bacterium]